MKTLNSNLFDISEEKREVFFSIKNGKIKFSNLRNFTEEILRLLTWDESSFLKRGGQIFGERVITEWTCERGPPCRGAELPLRKFWKISFQNERFKVLK